MKTGAQVVYDALSPLVAKAVDALHHIGDKQDRHPTTDPFVACLSGDHNFLKDRTQCYIFDSSVRQRHRAGYTYTLSRLEASHKSQHVPYTS